MFAKSIDNEWINWKTFLNHVKSRSSYCHIQIYNVNKIINLIKFLTYLIKILSIKSKINFIN